MPTVGQPVPGYYYDAFTDTLRPITGGPGPKGDPGNANVTVSPNAPAVAGKAGDLWVQTTTTPWTAPASMPWGVIAWKDYGVGTSVAIGTTPAEVCRLTNVPLLAGRLYKMTFGARAANSVTAAHSMRFHTPNTVAIVNTTLLFEYWVYSGLPSDYGCLTIVAPFTVGGNGSFTLPINGTGVVAGMNIYVSVFMVEDIGPNRGQQ